MHIIGTAGHVDHGKSALVAALTGTNPDRWIEEQLRGMTLDLGFAHLTFDDGVEAGIVDVPGHERFLHNMLAGAAGMELLLLVVAANEGVMPQTREHLAILRFLNVRRSLVAVTKIDLLEHDERAAAVQEIRAQLAGTIVAGAQFVPVSTLTGEGTGELRTAIRAELSALPERSTDAPAFLPIDRVFALPGLGTVVTGTLMQGRIALADQLQVTPQNIPVRVRSLHVFGTSRKDVTAGSRVAINLPGVDTSEIARGDVLADAQFKTANSFRVAFTPLPESLGMLRRRNPVRAYIGSAEVLGTLVFEQAPQAAEQVAADLYLRRPLATYPHANFVVRRMSPKTLLGGGTLQFADDAAPAEHAPGDDAVASVLDAAKLQPLTPAQVAARANIREEAAGAALVRMAQEKRAFAIAKPAAYIGARAAQDFQRALVAHFEDHEQRSPWVLGRTSRALARDLAMPEDVLIRMLGALAEDGQIAARSGYYSSAAHVPKLSAEQRAFFETVLQTDPHNPFYPVALADVVELMRVSKASGLAQAFDTLVVRGAVVKVGDALYRGTQIAAIHARLEGHFAAHKDLTMAQFRDLIGTSRKYAVPLLEWFDAREITVRSGDFRLLRAKRRS